MVSHNNDRKYYRIAIDTAKEGDEIFNLTEYFKGRVGDRNYGLQMTWYEQGSLKNVKGLKPYIRGNVGHYSIGDDGEIIMAPDAAVVSYVGDPSDTDVAGRVVYHFPEQMFPQEGIFYGFIGLIDDSDGDQRLSGVNVWFKVLAGVAYMGKASAYYINEIDKLIHNSEEQIRQLLDQSQKDVDAKQAALQAIVDDYKTKMSDLIDRLNAQGQTTNSMMETVKAGLSALEAKIQQDGLFTQAEADQFKKSVEDKINQDNLVNQSHLDAFKQMINDELAKFNGETVSEISKASRRLDHQFEYLSMGINIADGIDGQTLFNNEYSACQNNLMDFTLIDRVDVPSTTATTFTPTSDTAMKSAIDKLHQNGRKILMLKPHLFIGGSEIYRENYKPTDLTAFFTNWQTFLEREAKICTENDIPVLCIEVEMNTVFSDANFDRIKTLISNLKQKYPDLKLTAACNKFFVEGFKKILSLVDIIGINVYPAYASSIPANVAQMSVPEAAEFMFNSDQLAQKIDDTVLEFHKPIIITEIGIYPFKEGLLQPLLSMDTHDVIDGKAVPDFNVTALAMQAAIEGLAYASSVIGVSWFASGVPMFFKDYYREDAAVPNVAEQAWNGLSKAYYWEGR